MWGHEWEVMLLRGARPFKAKLYLICFNNSVLIFKSLDLSDSTSVGSTHKACVLVSISREANFSEGATPEGGEEWAEPPLLPPSGVPGWEGGQKAQAQGAVSVRCTRISENSQFRDVVT